LQLGSNDVYPSSINDEGEQNHCRHDEYGNDDGNCAAIPRVRGSHHGDAIVTVPLPVPLQALDV
jgi:hypothetical protein